MNLRKKIRIRFALAMALALIVGVIAYPPITHNVPWVYNTLTKLKINLGLDLQGGIHLEYRADVSQIAKDKVDAAVTATQNVVERRVNAFGVGESVVQASHSGGEYRIIVELPGVKDIEDAKNKIKDTPKLEFREENPNPSDANDIISGLNAQAQKQAQDTLVKATAGEDFSSLATQYSQDPGSKDKGGDLGFVKKGTLVPEFDAVLFNPDFKDGQVWPSLVETQYGWHIIKKIESRGSGDNLEIHAAHILFSKASIDMIPELKYSATGLTGSNLKDVQVVFPQQGIGEPQVSIKFDDAGTKLFAEITKRNIGKPLAIFLDGELKSSPTVQQEITTGDAVISGNFTVDEANRLKEMIDQGALPVPLELVSQYSIEASLGAESLQKSLFAGMVGVVAVMIFMILYYRILGVVAALALLIYAGLMIAIFKLSGTYTAWPITLSLSGIAGFILTMGIAVDANVLIFERMREEMRLGKTVARSIDEGFRRAWPSIRDGNYSTMITSLILIWMGTSFVKGFAIILVLGVLASMFTAIVMVRIILKFVGSEWLESRHWLIGSASQVEPPELSSVK